MIVGTAVMINPSRLGEFSSCPPSVREQLDHLVQKHKDKYEGLLKNKADFRLASGQGSENPTIVTGQATVAEETANPVSLPSLDSEQALREVLGEKCVESKIFASTACKILCSEQGDAYLLPKESYTMPKNTVIAGIGAGKVVNEPSGPATGVELQFPQGDKTYIEVACGSSGGTGDDDNNVKLKKGSAYMVLKDIQASNPQALKVTGYDISIRQVQGSHGYNLTAIDGERWFFVPKETYRPGVLPEQLL